jgi:endonuclease/exonuclease/phosphatase family metal-dependent hydrolase
MKLSNKAMIKTRILTALTFAFVLIAALPAHAQNPGKATSPTPAGGATNVATSMTVSWAAGGGATSYDVRFGTTNPPSIVSSSQTARTYSPSTLSYARLYYWRVDSRKGNKVTNGQVWKFTTAAASELPSAPSGPSPATGASPVASGTPLSWVVSSNATSYEVSFGTTNPPPVVSADQVAAAYQPATAVAYSTTYFWKVVAKSPAGTTSGPVWSFTAAAAPPPPNPVPVNLDRLRLMTWNVRSGLDASGAPGIDAQVAAMAESGAHVIGLQEVGISSQGDLPALYKSKLETLTARTWYSVWIPEPWPTTMTPMGNLILSTLPIVLSATTQFDTAPWDPTRLDAKRAAGQITVDANGVLVNIIITHLALNAGDRQTQLDMLQNWASSFPTPRLVGGALNMIPGDAAYTDLTGGFKDAWFTLVGTTDNGFTTDAYEIAPNQPGRVDYWLHELNDTHAVPTEMFVVQTSLGAHRPVVIDVKVQ